MKEKKEKSTVLVIITILFLAIFIIVPPTLRILYPKTEANNNKNKDDTMETTVLNCTKTNITEQYRITSAVTYSNEEATKNIITYHKLTAEELAQVGQPGGEQTTGKTVAEELALFQSVPSLSIKTEATDTIVTITSKDIDNNKEILDLLNYLQGLTEQESFYATQGYACQSTRT